MPTRLPAGQACRGRGQSLPCLLVALTAGALLSGVRVAQGQEIEPRTYSNAPVGVNFLIVGSAFTRGGLPSDSALPLTDPELDTSSAVLSYARVFDLRGMSGKFDAIAPYTWLSGSANSVDGPVDRHNSVNLYVSRGVFARTGNDFDLIGIAIAWQLRCGGGL
ncbi:hypothetical protein [Thiocapsa bogorovii]|uniref:hypothetical protein n=1 Tax=Thiocapsa bogorovii TaxID=521689 RepID=UPI001E2CA942|nr:hypothetical protein [Thiocapsa bogorovii]UHD18021.1 hypothetical protein LT988_08285 [Thiocapsa bogorovii]